MKSIVITGGSQGIGLEFTRQYLKKGFQVFATSRNPSESQGLQQLGKSYPIRLVTHPLDVGDEKSRRVFYQDLSTYTDSLDLLINNAGIISGNEEFPHPFGALDQEGLSKIFLVNTIAPLMMAENFFPLLRKGADPIVVNITSDNGSIARRNHKGKYGYCASKAALNMITKILSHDLRDHEIKIISLHPGWVKTPMTQHENAPLDPKESIQGMIKVIESLEMEDTGKFLSWEGEPIPW
jgi:NAD(P)-dependent dehydrogenase (short-subunit alcohol dehydrogenase family)